MAPFEAAQSIASKNCLVVHITPCLLGPDEDAVNSTAKDSIDA